MSLYFCQCNGRQELQTLTFALTIVVVANIQLSSFGQNLTQNFAIELGFQDILVGNLYFCKYQGDYAQIFDEQFLWVCGCVGVLFCFCFC